MLTPCVATVRRMQIIAALAADSTAYRLLVFGHIASAIIGFGSTFVYPVIGAHAKKVRGIGAAEISNASEKSGKFLSEPFIIATAVFGVVLALTGPYEFGDRFVGMALGLFILALAFSFGVHLPNLKKMNELANELAAMGPPPVGAQAGPPPQAVEMERRGKLAARNGGILQLALAAMLILMVWKPL